MEQEVDVLTPLQKEFLSLFFNSSVSEFFRLGAGTALAAYYLQHRLSEDLDFFTLDQNLDLHKVNAEVSLIIEKLDLSTHKHVSTPEYVQFILIQEGGESLKIDFVRELGPQFGKPQTINSVFVDSLENIAVNKVLSLYGRFDAKDFVDLYFLVRDKELDFFDLVEKAKKKYPGLSEFYFASNIADARHLKNYPQLLKNFDRNKMIDFYSRHSEKMFERVGPETT